MSRAGGGGRRGAFVGAICPLWGVSSKLAIGVFDCACLGTVYVLFRLTSLLQVKSVSSPLFVAAPPRLQHTVSKDGSAVVGQLVHDSQSVSCFAATPRAHSSTVSQSVSAGDSDDRQNSSTTMTFKREQSGCAAAAAARATSVIILYHGRHLSSASMSSKSATSQMPLSTHE